LTNAKLRGEAVWIPATEERIAFLRTGKPIRK